MLDDMATTRPECTDGMSANFLERLGSSTWRVTERAQQSVARLSIELAHHLDSICEWQQFATFVINAVPSMRAAGLHK